CNTPNPTVNVTTKQRHWFFAGSPVKFAVTVKDNDIPACVQATFNLGDTLPSGWSGVWNATALTLSPGQSGQATLTVTSPTGTVDGFYNLGIAATNASSPSYTNSLTATYVISTPVPASVAVSTNQPSYTGGQTVAISVSVTSGGNPVSGAAVSVVVNKPSGGASTLSGTTASNGVALVSYRLSHKAAKGMYQTTGSANSASASTTFMVQ